MRAEERRGAAAILVSAVGYGFTGILAKLALDAGVRVLPLVAWRFFLAAALVWLVLALRRRPVAPVRRWPPLLGLGLLYSIDALAFIAALQWVPVATAVLVFYVYPVVVVLLAAAFLGERLTAHGARIQPRQLVGHVQAAVRREATHHRVDETRSLTTARARVAHLS